jgi:hypothetical protein
MKTFKYSQLQRKIGIPTVLTVVLLFQIACGVSAPSTPAATPTLPPQDTATALPTDTLVPTATATPKPTATPVPPTATPDKAATEAAKATQAAEEMIALVQSDLEDVGFSTDQGHLGFYLPDKLKYSTDSYMGTVLEGVNEESFHNFVFQTDVTWNSKGGLAGCLIGFRSEEDVIDGAQYRFYMMRLQNAPMWDFEYWKNDAWQVTLTGDVKFSGSIDDSQGGHNTITLVVNENDLIPYINGDKHFQVNTQKLSDGIISLGVFQESGETSCEYSNTWLWVLE